MRCTIKNGSALRNKGPAFYAFVLSLFYVLVAAAYIVFSTRIAEVLARDAHQLQEIETIKGIVFVLVTGGSLFGIGYIWEKRSQRQNMLLVQSERRAVAGLCSASIAHDLNNFLQVFRSVSDLCKQKEEKDEELYRIFELLDDSAARLSKLAGSLVHASQKVNVHESEAVDLPDQIADIMKLLRQHPEVRQCRLSIGEVPRVLLPLNLSLFELAMMNLIVNAAQAAGAGGQVEVVSRLEGNRVRVEVHDDGAGLAASTLDDIFEPGYTTKSSGNGLGMLSVRAFAVSCGGDVTVHLSHLGGAAFRISIPLNEVSKQAAA